MKIKTSELTGRALDWAVGIAEGLNVYIGWPPNNPIPATYCDLTGQYEDYSPSTSWAQGGPIIEREQIYWIDNGRTDRAGKSFKWMATKNFSDPLNNFYGPTSLIAAMRCYVASKLGDEIEIPDSLGE